MSRPKRRGFSDKEDVDMLNFIYEQLRRRTPHALEPKGLQLWEQYIGYFPCCERTAHSLSTHYRKHIDSRIHTYRFSSDRMFYILKRLKKNVEKFYVRLGLIHGYEIEITENGTIASYTKIRDPSGAPANPVELSDDEEGERGSDEDQQAHEEEQESATTSPVRIPVLTKNGRSVLDLSRASRAARRQQRGDHASPMIAHDNTIEEQEASGAGQEEDRLYPVTSTPRASSRNKRRQRKFTFSDDSDMEDECRSKGTKQSQRSVNKTKGQGSSQEQGQGRNKAIDTHSERGSVDVRSRSPPIPCAQPIPFSPPATQDQVLDESLGSLPSTFSPLATSHAATVNKGVTQPPDTFQSSQDSVESVEVAEDYRCDASDEVVPDSGEEQGSPTRAAGKPTTVAKSKGKNVSGNVHTRQAEQAELKGQKRFKTKSVAKPTSPLAKRTRLGFTKPQSVNVAPWYFTGDGSATNANQDMNCSQWRDKDDEANAVDKTTTNDDEHENSDLQENHWSVFCIPIPIVMGQSKEWHASVPVSDRGISLAKMLQEISARSAIPRFQEAMKFLQEVEHTAYVNSNSKKQYDRSKQASFEIFMKTIESFGPLGESAEECLKTVVPSVEEVIRGAPLRPKVLPLSFNLNWATKEVCLEKVRDEVICEAVNVLKNLPADAAQKLLVCVLETEAACCMAASSITDYRFACASILRDLNTYQRVV